MGLGEMQRGGCTDLSIPHRCTNCEASNKNRTLPLDLIIDQKIKPLGIPAFTGAMFGMSCGGNV
jgi:hypothetical protein